MATTKAKAKSKTKSAGFTTDLLKAINEVGEAEEVRFKLRQIRLSDGEYHKLTKPVTVRVKWSDAVQLYVAYDSKYYSSAQGSSPREALSDYFHRWCVKVDDLVTHEDELGKGSMEHLNEFRSLLSLHAH